MNYRIGFIIEQIYGHITHGQNLRRNITEDNTVEAYWGLPAWDTHRWSSWIPVYKSNWTVRAGMQARRELAMIQRQTTLDAIFFHTQITAMLAQDWLKRVPSVVSIDATPIQYDSLGDFYQHKPGPRWIENLKWRLNRDCFRKARHIVTWSAWAKQGLVDDYEVPAEKVTVIPPGVNIHEWTLPRPRDLDRETLKILFVGGNMQRKGGMDLLKAFQTLRLEAPFNVDGKNLDIELHLVTRDHIPDQPGVFVYNDMLPNSQPLKELYFDSDIFCLPSYGDCLPMVLSEAGAAEMPLISTKVAAIPEIVLDEYTGALVPPGDVQSLTSALRQIIINPELRRQMGVQARKLVSQNFHAENNAERLLKLLKEMIDTERGDKACE